jgi:hypothetical protein
MAVPQELFQKMAVLASQQASVPIGTGATVVATAAGAAGIGTMTMVAVAVVASASAIASGSVAGSIAAGRPIDPIASLKTLMKSVSLGSANEAKLQVQHQVSYNLKFYRWNPVMHQLTVQLTICPI